MSHYYVRTLITLAIPAMIFAGVCWAADGDPAPMREFKFGARLTKALASTDDDEQHAGAEAVIQDRAEIIRQLLPFVTPATQPEERDVDAKYWAVTVLGEMRAEEAVPLLMRNLEYRWKPMESKYGYADTGDPFKFRPACKALTKIGMPAVEPIMRYLCDIQADGERRRDLQGRCAFMLEVILGDRFALALLRDELNRLAKAAPECANLEAAIAILERRDPATRPAEK
jgi:hypothetical protein